MRKITDLFRNFARTGDLVLLFLCLLANSFGCLIVASTTNYMGSSRNIIIQIFAMFLGILIYIILTNIDVEISRTTGVCLWPLTLRLWPC